MILDLIDKGIVRIVTDNKKEYEVMKKIKDETKELSNTKIDMKKQYLKIMN